MKVFIDTNIIIDILEHRKSFFANSYRILQLGLEGKIKILMSAGAVTDVYYIINRSLQDATIAREKIFALSNLISICNTTSDDINNAITLYMKDFEDAVIASIAKREKADLIITRNEADFVNSPVPAKSPHKFLIGF